MSAQIRPFRDAIAPSQSIGHFVCIGDTGHLKLADLHAAGRIARQVKGLKVPIEEAESRKIDASAHKKRLIAHSERLEKLHATLEHFHETHADSSPRAREAVHRTPMLKKRGSSRQ